MRYRTQATSKVLRPARIALIGALALHLGAQAFNKTTADAPPAPSVTDIRWSAVGEPAAPASLSAARR